MDEKLKKQGMVSEESSQPATEEGGGGEEISCNAAEAANSALADMQQEVAEDSDSSKDRDEKKELVDEDESEDGENDKLRRSTLDKLGNASEDTIFGQHMQSFDKEDCKKLKVVKVDLGNESQVLHIPRFLPSKVSSNYLHYLDKKIPWTRPTIRVFGRSCLQPRDTCYVASSGLTELVYSGYKPRVYSWDDFPILKDILAAVQKALPGSNFNSLLLNRYSSGNDYVGWHADDEKLYGPTPEIASVSFGCQREFFLKKKPCKNKHESEHEERSSKRRKMESKMDKHSFTLKHGSLLVMRGFTQRDWVHSVPKRAKADALRINLTFRRVLF